MEHIILKMNQYVITTKSYLAFALQIKFIQWNKKKIFIHKKDDELFNII